MEVTVVGSGTVAPSAARTAAAYWVTTGPVRLLMDCGAGTLHRLAEFRIPWPTVTHVAISHFHLDHWGELPMFLYAQKYGTRPARTGELVLIGPPGFENRLTILAGALGDWVLSPGYPLRIREITAGTPVELAPGVELDCFPTPHTAESVAYSVRAEDARLVYTGDTGESDELARWAAGCDVLIAECSLPDDQAMDIHLTPTRAATMARTAQARRLVLTHFYPQIEGTDPAGVARRTFTGEVNAASDGDRFRVGNGG